jgi:glycosyltransferase involved in cell wall biosynthesis
MKSLIIGSTIAQTLSLGRHRLGRLYRRIKYRKIKAFHFTCRKLLDEAVVRTAHDFVIPLGVDTSMFYPMSSGHGRNVRFLFVGRLETSKGIDILLSAWRIVKESARGVELHIAGSGSLKNVVKSEASVIYHESTYQGGRGEHDLGALYRNCDIFVFPSIHETFGFVVLEALASGLFVITSPALRGIFDVFAEKYDMLEYVERESSRFAAAMLRAHANITDIKSRKMIASDFARSNYNWGTISAQFFATVRQLVATLG